MSGTSNQPSSNHPRGDLLDEGRRRDYFKICVPLYQASVIGDWEAVENILNINPELKDDLLGYSITQDWDTTLMIAVSSQSIKLVEHLVNRMTDQQLTLQDKHGCTALYSAGMVGTVDMAKAMVGKCPQCPQLLTIRADDNKLPIHAAALSGKHNMVAYLYDEYKSTNYMTDNDIQDLFSRCIQADLFDSALRILDDQNNQIGFPHAGCARLVLYDLAQKTSAFEHKKSWKNSNKDGNNMLHLAGMEAKSPLKDVSGADVSGAAFQMQRELLWFKEVKSKATPYSREKKNGDGHTPLQLFIENHREMASKGENWMKETANQCMVVATLITTVVFSAAFTIPGGYDQEMTKRMAFLSSSKMDLS